MLRPAAGRSFSAGSESGSRCSMGFLGMLIEYVCENAICVKQGRGSLDLVRIGLLL